MLDRLDNISVLDITILINQNGKRFSLKRSAAFLLEKLLMAPMIVITY